MALAFAGLAAAPAASEPTDPGAALVAASRHAGDRLSFTGTLRVSWPVDGATRRAAVGVKAEDGVTTLDGDQTVAADPGQVLLEAQGWQRIWTGDDGASGAPAATEKWTFSVPSAVTVLGRPAHEVTVRPRGGGAVVERLTFDDATRLLLARVQYAADGSVSRAVEFTRLDITKSDGTPRTLAEPNVRDEAPAAAPEAWSDAPGTAGKGFALVGRYLRDDGVVEVSYSDGLFSASVFRQDGRLDWSALSGLGSATTIAGRKVLEVDAPSAHVMLWEDGNHVFTYVSDAPPGDAAAMLETFAGSGGPDGAGELANRLIEPFLWVRIDGGSSVVLLAT